MKTTFLAIAAAAALTVTPAAAQQPAQPPPDPELQQGITLDLQGNYDEARTHIKRAIDAATTPDAASRATRALAVSYAFESNCKEAAAVEAPLYDKALTAKAFNEAGELANEQAASALNRGMPGRRRRGTEKASRPAGRTPRTRTAGRNSGRFDGSTHRGASPRAADSPPRPPRTSRPRKPCSTAANCRRSRPRSSRI